MSDSKYPEENAAGRSESQPAETNMITAAQATKASRVSAYLKSLEPFEDEELNRLREEAEQNGVPIIRPETESFLRTMLKITKPKRILEIGTAVGYSSIMMAKACDAGIETIENYEKRIPVARKNIGAAGLADRIRLIEGDAGQVLKELAGKLSKEKPAKKEPVPMRESDRCGSEETENRQQDGGTYDFIFLDAAKGQYLNWLPDILKLMHPGSILVTDNVLQDETVMESRYLIPRRERTTHARMREYLYEIKHHPKLSTSVLPVGDGVSLSCYCDT